MKAGSTHSEEPSSNGGLAASGALLHHEEPRTPHFFCFLLAKLCVLRGEMGLPVFDCLFPVLPSSLVSDALQIAVHASRAAGAPDRCIASPTRPWSGHPDWWACVLSASATAAGGNTQSPAGLPE